MQKSNSWGRTIRLARATDDDLANMAGEMAQAYPYARITKNGLANMAVERMVREHRAGEFRLEEWGRGK